ncbi:MAG TPA: EAL domain-containing protein [Acidimicrobiales bacterium]
MAAATAHLEAMQPPAPVLPVVHRATLTLLTVVAAAAVAFQVLQRPLGLTSADRSLGLLVLIAVAATAVALRSVWLPARRLTWMLTAVALVLWLPAQGIHVRAASADRLTYATVADLLVVVSYALLSFAVLALAREHSKVAGRGVILSAILTALTVAALSWAAGASVIDRWADSAHATRAVAIALPAAVSLLLALAAGTVVVAGPTGSRSAHLLCLGLAVVGATDVMLLAISGHDRSDTRLPVLLLWTAGLGLVAAAAWLDRGLPAVGARRRDGMVLSIVCVVLPALLLVGAGVTHIHTLAVLLAGAAVLVGVTRMRMAILDARSADTSRRQALTDELTGLPNRRHFYEHLRVALDHAERDESTLAMLLIDLDRFKDVNDSLGHASGDELLRDFGHRLVGLARSTDLVARLGGDEFAVVLHVGSTESDGRIVAERISKALIEPFTLDNVSVRIDGSVGIAVFPEHAQTADELLQRADIAMYQAKDIGAGTEMYRHERDGNSRERLTLIGELRDGIDHGEMVVHYQPKLDLATNSVTGVEALVRWQHPTKGLLPPSAFLDLALRTGLMRPLTLTVLDSALRQCRRWRDQGLTLTVDINLSAPSLVDDRLLDDLDAALSRHGLPAQVLGLEITEDVLLAEPDRAQGVMRALRRCGMRIALDDYGSGYSSLAYLGKLPIDELKLDKYFVARMGMEANATAIVRSTLELAHSLNMRFVAEGVETAEQLHALREQGCDIAQGFFISKPLPAEAFTEWLASRDFALAAASA